MLYCFELNHLQCVSNLELVFFDIRCRRKGRGNITLLSNTSRWTWSSDCINEFTVKNSYHSSPMFAGEHQSTHNLQLSRSSSQGHERSDTELYSRYSSCAMRFRPFQVLKALSSAETRRYFRFTWQCTIYTVITDLWRQRITGIPHGHRTVVTTDKPISCCCCCCCVLQLRQHHYHYHRRREKPSLVWFILCPCQHRRWWCWRRRAQRLTIPASWSLRTTVIGHELFSLFLLTTTTVIYEAWVC